MTYRFAGAPERARAWVVAVVAAPLALAVGVVIGWLITLTF